MPLCLRGKKARHRHGRLTIKAILFDIDGTLLKCFGAGKKSLIAACTEVFGTVGRMEAVDFQGKTDPLILRESLGIMGFADDDIDVNIGRLKERYFHHLRANMRDSSSVLLPGVTGLLERLAGQGASLVGLLTGNFRESARIKLERFGLNEYFPFGVFGDDAAYRNEMPAIARSIINDEYRVSLPFSDMVIIGDTKYDILCAQSVGAVSVAVGTGWAEPEALRSFGPDHFFEDLSDTDRIMAVIGA